MQGTPDEIRRRYNLEEEKVSGSNFSLPEFISIDEPNEILGVDGTLEINGNLYINSKLVKAWVVESGTSSGWKYRKYSDNTFECWRIFGFQPSSSSINGNIYYSNTASVALPFTVTDGVAVGSCNTELVWVANTSISTTAVSFRMGKGNTINTSTTYNIRLVVFGTY